MPAAPGIALSIELTRVSAEERFGFSVVLSDVDVQGQRVVVIGQLVAGSPAANNGTFKVGQRVLAINDTAVNDNLGLVQQALNGTSLTLHIQVSEEPVVAASAILRPRLRAHIGEDLRLHTLKVLALPTHINGLGFRIAAARESNGPQPAGVYVASIDSGAPAGLRVGQRLLEVCPSGRGRSDSLVYANAIEAHRALLTAKANGEALIAVVDDPVGFEFFSDADSLPGGFDVVWALPPTPAATEAAAAVAPTLPAVSPASTARPTAVGEANGGATTPRTNRRESRIVSKPPFFVQAMFSWQANSRIEGELSFNNLDVLEVTSFGDRAWWHARHLSTGAEGKIPSRSAYEHFYKSTPAWILQQANAERVYSLLRDKDQKVGGGKGKEG